MLLEALQLPFFQRALLAGLAVALLLGFLAPLVVQRRLSFLSHGLAHSAFGGVAVALFLGWPPLWVALPFTVLVALGITWVRRYSQLSEDSGIGVFLAASLALGMVLLSRLEAYSSEALAYLFGSILAVTPADLGLLGGAVLLTAVLSPLWAQWAYATFDADLARADHRSVDLHDFVLAALLAVVTVVSVKLVGALLVGAMMVIPATVGRLLSRTFAGLTLVSLVSGLLAVLTGLAISFVLDWPSGASMVLALVAQFALAWIFRKQG